MAKYLVLFKMLSQASARRLTKVYIGMVCIIYAIKRQDKWNVNHPVEKLSFDWFNFKRVNGIYSICIPLNRCLHFKARFHSINRLPDNSILCVCMCHCHFKCVKCIVCFHSVIHSFSSIIRTPAMWCPNSYRILSTFLYICISTFSILLTSHLIYDHFLFVLALNQRQAFAVHMNYVSNNLETLRSRWIMERYSRRYCGYLSE